jgi:hypothetical protein
VPCNPGIEAAKSIWSTAAYFHLADVCWGSMTEVAAGHCSTGEAALVQLLQHNFECWIRQLQQTCLLWVT